MEALGETGKMVLTQIGLSKRIAEVQELEQREPGGHGD